MKKVYVLYKQQNYLRDYLYVIYADKQKAYDECDKRNNEAESDANWFVEAEDFIE